MSGSASPGKEPDAPETGDEEELEALQRQCAELERLLRQDALSFENEALEVQLVQMQDDYTSLQDDFRSMREYFGRRIADMSTQLEERKRRAGRDEGHANCLRDLLGFHENNGLLAGSYWQAQCEKRDDSIRFLSLKLQEYTVPSAEYRSRRHGGSSSTTPGVDDESVRAAAVAVDDVTVSWPSSPSRSSPPGGRSPPSADRGSKGGAAVSRGSSSAARAAEGELQALYARHVELCQETQQREDEAWTLETELEACQLRCCELRAVHGIWLRRDDHSQGSLEDPGGDPSPSSSSSAARPGIERAEAVVEENKNDVEEVLGEKLKAWREASARRRTLPPWAQRCVWRDELDIRAGQLERISLQFDATKRSLDAANEELQWQATSAEALRVRLEAVLLAAEAEERRGAEVGAEERRREPAAEELLRRWASLRPGAPLPLAFQQARQLLDAMREGEAAGTGGKPPPPPPPAVAKTSGGGSSGIS